MSFKYDVLGHVRFGYELNDILTLKGIEDIDSFLHPTIKHVESEELFDNIQLIYLLTVMLMDIHLVQIYINIPKE